MGLWLILFSSLFFSVVSIFSKIITYSKYERWPTLLLKKQKSCCFSPDQWEKHKPAIGIPKKTWAKAVTALLICFYSVFLCSSLFSIYEIATNSKRLMTPQNKHIPAPHNGTFQNSTGIFKNASGHASRSWGKSSTNLNPGMTMLLPKYTAI